MNELEGVWKSEMQVLPDGTVLQSEPGTTHNTTIVRLMMLFVSFVVGITMMNLFIAMLCLSYSRATEKAKLDFMRSRCCMVLDLYAARLGTKLFLQPFCLCCCRRRRRLPHRSALNLRSNSNSDLLDGTQTGMRYIWICHSKE